MNHRLLAALSLILLILPACDRDDDEPAVQQNIQLEASEQAPQQPTPSQPTAPIEIPTRPKPPQADSAPPPTEPPPAPLPPPPRVKLCATSPICPGAFYRPTVDEQGYGRGNGFVANRKEYWATDSVAQFFLFYGRAEYTNRLPITRLRLELELRSSGAVVASLPLAELQTFKLEIRIDLPELPPGDYTLRADVIDTLSGQRTPLYRLEAPLRKTRQSAEQGAFPSDGVSIDLHEIEGQGRLAWPISTGIPFPQGALSSVDGLMLLEDGREIPAQFTSRATWEPGGPIKWLGVDFLATYENGRPRAYRLASAARREAQASTLSVSQNDDEIVVTTGAARFLIKRRRFTGIEAAWLDSDGNGRFDAAEKVLDGPGGPFLVDDGSALYSPLADARTLVAVEESGPVRATIVAKGYYMSDRQQELGKFATRLSFFAGQPSAQISHRTTLTQDTRTARRIADAGWEFALAENANSWTFGGDGRTATGTAGSGSTFLHQERANAYHIDTPGGTVARGTRADGWLTHRGRGTAASIIIRDIFQKYPKELELNNDPRLGKPRLVAHFWPKHGHPVFTPQEETSRANLHKIFFAHQGPLLNFNLPQSYADQLKSLHETPGQPDAGWDVERQIAEASQANAQGISIGNELLLVLHSPSRTDAETAEFARAFQQAPHGLADPRWNAASGVEGRLAARDPNFFPALEKHIDLSLPRYHDYVIDETGEYGMWIYADVHNNWLPDRNVPSLHRIWQASHYQNVYAGWLLYFRSNLPEWHAWARVNSDHFRDVQTLSAPRDTVSFGKAAASSMMHCKGFLPWAGELSIGNHFVDISNFLLKYYLTGDRHAWDMVEQWKEFNVRTARTEQDQAPARSYTCQEAAALSLRINLPWLGEIVSAYEATWDPQLLHYLADPYELNVPFECTISPAQHPVAHPHWFIRYHRLMRDPRVVERLASWVKSGYTNYMANAFLYQETRDRSYLNAVIPMLYDDAHRLYDNEADRYHGYSASAAAADAQWLKEAPYLLQAMKDANMSPSFGERFGAYPARATIADRSVLEDKNSRGWTNAGTTVLLLPRDTKLSLNTTLRSEHSGIAFLSKRDGTRLFEEPFGRRAHLERAIAAPAADDYYLFQCATEECIFTAPVSGLDDGRAHAAAEVGVLPRTHLANGQFVTSKYLAKERQLFFVRPYRQSEAVTLKFSAEPSLSLPRPIYIRMEDATGRTLLETSLFAYGSRAQSSVALNSTRNPLPWRLYTTGEAGPSMQIQAGGAEELFLSIRPEYFDAILPRLRFP